MIFGQFFLAVSEIPFGMEIKLPLILLCCPNTIDNLVVGGERILTFLIQMAVT